MERRTATKLIMTGALATPSLILPDRSEATVNDFVPPVALLPLILILSGNRQFRPASLIILLTATVMAVMSLKREIHRRDIQQADASKILGGLFSQPVQTLILQAQLIGLFFAVNEYLIFKPFKALEKPDSVSFVNQDNHFYNDFRGRNQVIPESLAQYTFRDSRAIGRGYLHEKTGRLIGAFPPYDDFREPNA